MIRNILSILIVLCVRCHSFSPRTLLSNSNSFHNKQLHQLYKSQYNGFHHRRGRQKVVEHISSVASVSDGRVYEVTRRRDIKDRLQQSIVSACNYLRFFFCVKFVTIILVYSPLCDLHVDCHILHISISTILFLN